jgi:hypothetical protein
LADRLQRNGTQGVAGSFLLEKRWHFFCPCCLLAWWSGLWNSEQVAPLDQTTDDDGTSIIYYELLNPPVVPDGLIIDQTRCKLSGWSTIQASIRFSLLMLN